MTTPLPPPPSASPPPPPPAPWALWLWILVALVLVIFGLELWFGFDVLPAPLSFDSNGKGTGCYEIYAMFRREAHSGNAVGIAAGVLGVGTTVMFMVLAPDPSGGSTGLWAAMRSQPKTPLGALAALLFLYMHHRFEIQDCARDLAARAIDIAVGNSWETEHQRHQACTALRSRWETTLGGATSTLGNGLRDLGKGTKGDSSAATRVDKARFVASDVRVKAEKLSSVSTMGAQVDAAQAESVLDELREDRKRLGESVVESRVSLAQAKREGAPPAEIEAWDRKMEQIQGKLVELNILEEQARSQIPSTDGALVSTEETAEVADHQSHAAGELEAVAEEVQKFLDTGEPSP